MKRPFILAVVLISLYATSCHSNAGDTVKTGQDTIMVDPDHPALPPFKKNPEFRAHVKKEPVAEYKAKTPDPLNSSYFTVSLYETPKTMYYLARVDFEGLGGEDTIKLPDLGTAPHPVLQKGNDTLACIIGFLDNDRKFREMKLVYVTGNGKQLKIKALHHWVVGDHYRLVSE